MAPSIFFELRFEAADSTDKTRAGAQEGQRALCRIRHGLIGKVTDKNEINKILRGETLMAERGTRKREDLAAQKGAKP